MSKKPKHFTFKDAKLAAKIGNDIAEGIDCGESREKLRRVIACWQDIACAESQKRAAAEANIVIFKAAKGLMDAALEKGINK